MTVSEIQTKIAVLDEDDLNSVITHAIHLKRLKQPDQRQLIQDRLNDQDPNHWVDLDDIIDSTKTD